jgi:hypothetical protein
MKIPGFESLLKFDILLNSAHFLNVFFIGKIEENYKQNPKNYQKIHLIESFDPTAQIFYSHTE